ncbi:YycH family regulatory protein [Jeotgalibacillus haloalkalitolerans]|uniref:Two-component system activity regulator YycH n=1 Tax=Jeotgalibacillus haloalkalitolerans TaxID=3104292 RepID=A0ABU5KHB2_9BACL|nr:two-component system activity regulator YycH [Jeotgalibacillus sp. HH7-29]MDZ5710622.1 two-component system activity regulator YycH [Jeotgalibacillus sp. HH7-29]
MMKRMELLKSILLSLLVVLSLVLTWNVWSYQPASEPYDESETTVENVSISEERTTRDLIQPSRFLVHGEVAVSGTSEENNINTLNALMQEWSIYNVQQNSTFDEEEFRNIVHGSNRIEILYPAEIPFSAYRDIVTFENNTLPEDSFDRVVIDVSGPEDTPFTVYFVHYDNRVVYEGRVDSTYFEDLNSVIVTNAAAIYTPLFAYETGERTIYLPVERREYSKYLYKMTTIDINLFRRALFQNPDAVELNQFGSSRDQYFDQSSNLMEVDRNNNTLSYVNPSAELSTVGRAGELFQKSRRFVNEHEGWVDTYYLYDLDAMDQEVTFRMHEQGLPVFNDNGVAEMYQEWGETRIHQYARSFLTKQFEIPSESDTVSLGSGYDAIEAIESIEDFDPERLQDVTVGYYMTKNDSDNTYTLDPVWYYKYNDSWARVPVLGGGDPVGLE